MPPKRRASSKGSTSPPPAKKSKTVPKKTATSKTAVEPAAARKLAEKKPKVAATHKSKALPLSSKAKAKKVQKTSDKKAQKTHVYIVVTFTTREGEGYTGSHCYDGGDEDARELCGVYATRAEANKHAALLEDEAGSDFERDEPGGNSVRVEVEKHPLIDRFNNRN
jgi:hypothetical protein